MPISIDFYQIRIYSISIRTQQNEPIFANYLEVSNESIRSPYFYPHWVWGTVYAVILTMEKKK